MSDDKSIKGVGSVDKNHSKDAAATEAHHACESQEISSSEKAAQQSVNQKSVGEFNKILHSGSKSECADKPDRCGKANSESVGSVESQNAQASSGGNESNPRPLSTVVTELKGLLEELKTAIADGDGSKASSASNTSNSSRAAESASASGAGGGAANSANSRSESASSVTGSDAANSASSAESANASPQVPDLNRSASPASTREGGRFGIDNHPARGKVEFEGQDIDISHYLNPEVAENAVANLNWQSESAGPVVRVSGQSELDKILQDGPKAGHTYELEAGRYNTFDADFSGANGQPITFKAADGAEGSVILDGGGKERMDVTGSNLSFKNLTFENGGDGSMFITGGASNILVEGNEMSNSGRGIDVTGGASNVALVNNYIHDIGVSGSEEGDAISLWEDNDNVVVAGNVGLRTNDDVFDAFTSPNPIQFVNNLAIGGGSVNSVNDGGDGNGFKLGSSRTSVAHILSDNIALLNRNSGYSINGGVSPAVFDGNLSLGNAKSDIL